MLRGLYEMMREKKGLLAIARILEEVWATGKTRVSPR